MHGDPITNGPGSFYALALYQEVNIQEPLLKAFNNIFVIILDIYLENNDNLFWMASVV